MTVRTKDPDEVLDFTVDWVPELGSGDTISSSSWVDVDPGIGVALPPPSFTDTTATIWISGGTVGTVYSLTNRVVTTGGRTYDEELQVRVTPTIQALPEFGGCVWPIDPGCLTDEWDTYEESVRQRAVSFASATLSRLTAYRVSKCPVIARPAPRSRSCALGSGAFIPSNFGGTWTNTARGAWNPKELELPPPVSRLDEIKIDGVIQNLDDFVVYNRQIVTYVGVGDFAWPQVQDFTKLDTEPNTFSVTYLNAHPIDSMGAVAAGLLAVEFGKACSGDKKCRLPGNITQIVRQGVSFDVVSGSFPNGLTGIREVDTYTALWNVGGRGRPMLFDPGAPGDRVQTS